MKFFKKILLFAGITAGLSLTAFAQRDNPKKPPPKEKPPVVTPQPKNPPPKEDPKKPKKPDNEFAAGFVPAKLRKEA